jgi:hypothetical protein
MRGAPLCSLGCLAVAALPAGSAHAGADDRALGVSLAYAALAVPGRSPQGGAVALDYSHGLGDAVSLRVALLGGALVEDGDATTVGQGIAGISYALDILKYVPYVTLGAGAAVSGGAGGAALHPEIELGLGLDVLRGRSLSYGPFARVAAYLDESTLVTVGVRVATRWGIF